MLLSFTVVIVAVIVFLPLAIEFVESLPISVQPCVNQATGNQHMPDFNQISIDPVTGEELGKRELGAVWPITKEIFVLFLYRLHYTLHILELWGIDRWVTDCSVLLLLFGT